MKPFPLSHSEFGDSLRSVFHERFQEQVLRHLLHLHPSAQEVVLKQGDGGKDIVVYDIGRVYACYAPARLNDWEESDVIKKIRADLAKVKANLGDALKEWVFVHNHPQSALTNKLSDFVLQLRNDNPGIRYFDVWGMEQLWDQLTSPAPKLRREAYLRSVVAGFSRYEELALDDYRNDVPNPDIWDIFVHPACSPTHLSPEDIDRDEQARPANPKQFKPQHPTQDLLNLLAQPDHRRTVLLADPGMGKSTLVQSIIASLASGREFQNAPALTGLLPVPLILRDLVPLLDQTQPESWTWDSLVNALIERYTRGEKSPPLLDAYRSSPEHRDEFRSLIKTEANVFFLVDGLDEVGDLKKRKQIVTAIQEGIRWASKDTRWLITSRVIGYEEHPVEIISCQTPISADRNEAGGFDLDYLRRLYRRTQTRLRSTWEDFEIKGIPMHQGKFGTLPDDGADALPFEVKFDGSLSFGGFSASPRASVWASIPIAHRLHLAPFDNRRQDDFTQRWFEKRHSTDHSASLLREVRQHGHDGVRIISRVPNLLCMMNMLKRSGKPLPDGRHALYHEIVKAYNGGIDAAYFRSNPLSPHCPIEAPERSRLLAHLAAYMQHRRSAQTKADGQSSPNRGSQGNIVITRPEIEAQLVPVIAAWQSSGRIKDARPADDLLNELLRHVASRSGLLIPRSVDEHGQTVFGFTHLSFLEYFAACHVAEKLVDNEKRAQKMRRQGDRFDTTAWDASHCAGPIPVNAAQIAAWAGEPVWSEVLIFLAQVRSENRDDLDSLIEDMFPALIEGASFDASSKEPMMPFYAVDLAFELAKDRHLILSPLMIDRWRHLLWFAWVTFPGPWMLGEGGWPIGGTIEDDWDGFSISNVLRRHASEHPEAKVFRLLESHSVMTQADLVVLVEVMPNLEYLGLTDDNEITDLTEIGKLKRLKTLDLYGCADLSDLTPLAELSELNWLRFAGTQSLTDLSPLASITNLEFLDFNSCAHLTDLSPVAKLPSLKKLGIHYCHEITDCSPLFSMKSLTRLDITHCKGISHDHLNELRRAFPKIRLNE